jgi:sporulation related protein/PilZ domain-containing protein
MGERRQSPRFVVNSPVLVSLGGGEAGLLFDVGEGGLSIRGLIPKQRQDPISVAFDLNNENDPVYAWVGIAWTSDSKNRTGLRFVKMAERTQQRLKTWVGSRSGTTNLWAATGASEVIHLPAIDSTVIPLPARTKSEYRVAEMALDVLSRSPQSRRQLMLLLFVVILCPVFFLLGHYLPRIMASQRLQDVGVAPNANEAPLRSEIVSVNSSAAKPPILPARLDLNKPGFVLQVAAMSEEDHADALAVALNQKKFPAFTYRHSNDRFYKVAVGPYPDVSSSNQVKDELQRENYEALLRRWSPE